ncbi:MAG: CRISPR system precrRNA processing endoribonuclease RAMP protein Cas6 [Acidobacteriota bacterium]
MRWPTLGLGPTRGCATLSRVDDLATESILYDGHYLKNQEFLGCTFSFALSAPPIGRITVEFLTPTELKSEGAVVLQPEFSVLLARLRDRISNLRGLYQGGALEIDFGTLRREAEKIRIVRSNLRQVQAERLSSRTGQRHPLGGLVGDVEYAGELSSFLPFLRAGQWTGVGRQTVWGKGVLKVRGEGT